MAGGEHLGEHGLGDLAGDAAVLGHLQQVGELARPHRALVDALRPVVAEQFSADEVGELARVGEAGQRRLEVVGQFARPGEQVGGLGGQIELGGKPLPAGVGQLRQAGAHPLDPGLVDDHRDQVRVREIPIVVGLLLAAHGLGAAPVRVPEQGLLHHLAAVEEEVALPPLLVLQRQLHVAERVHVLQLGAGAELVLPLGPQADVGVAAEAALLHVAVADVEIADNGVQFPQVGGRLRGRAQVRLADDLQERRAGAVEVHVAHRFALVVHQLAGVLLHVDAGDADGPAAAVHLDLHPAVLADGQLELGDLVALGQVRVEIVLAGEAVFPVQGRSGGQPQLDGRLHHLAVEYRQGTGHAQADRAGVGVGRGAERGGAAAEDLTQGFHLGVDFQPDHGFEFHGCSRGG